VNRLLHPTLNLPIPQLLQPTSQLLTSPQLHVAAVSSAMPLIKPMPLSNGLHLMSPLLFAFSELEMLVRSAAPCVDCMFDGGTLPMPP
jgi:hypothetical protein